MAKRIFTLLLISCLLLSGCASLLERSYSSVEPYTDRYWDSDAEDTLKAESYQDLVNSLLMLIEQRSEEVVIRYYSPDDTDSYTQALRAKQEIMNETLLGSYLLENLTFTFSNGESYCTLTYTLTYRENVHDISTLMTLSDTQSLVDLLRLAVREGHDSLTAQFISRMSKEEIANAVEQLWQELYLDELEASGALTPPDNSEDPDDESAPTDDPEAGDDPQTGDEENTDDSSQTPDTTDPDTPPEDSELPPDGETDPLVPDNDPEDSEEPVEIPEPEPVIEFPPCPWQIIFYPKENAVEIVEIILK